ncbi:glycoside hydrolase family 2 TIM barrel-domain containing protein [Niabella drilacis]|uniref:beta-galactosidase n=1 Tax=Niabella drilacis (strain DSM 25811 / CCM 8410 / CCUG 62505 / LMG 26954 / E90) TaxID=1285928 RepID=A0A1G7A838_NIADE|nr:glycoside hydrolase family 2 TIM barrel-domain containing protein [Niabella drilacis]SDE10046.1 Beta-galactosidase/beta-glucuronidase [Niabella drilacis]
MPILKECFLLLLVLVTGIAPAQQYMADGRLHLPPRPAAVAGVAKPVQSLDGSWEINLNANATSVADNSATRDWQTIQVPGEALMQGFKIKHDTAFVYRRRIKMDTDTSGKRHIIRFNGVFNHARVYCNGHFVREHFGGFTAWDADITKYLKPGQDNWLHVSVTDRADDISYASGYAAHPIGGITRKVQYIVLPGNPVQYLYASAGLSGNDAAGLLSLKMQLPQAKNITATYTLTDATGNKRVTKPFKKMAGTVWSDSIRIEKIKTWTAETPYLYTLTVTVFQNGKPYETIVQPLGFRSVEINKDNEMLVNGRSVKLRGACRHDMHPLLGRSTNRVQDSLDVLLAKEANMNFIRTSHYPPSEDFLEFCDRYGIYVQEETAICFVLDWRSEPYLKYYKTMDDPVFTGRYLGQLSEMIDRDRNHAAVIMWSIGNESWYGTNFQKEYDFVKAVEPTRPVSWSFPTTALNQGKRCFDILVSHYPRYNGYPNTNGQTSDLGRYEKNMKADYPIIGDEWAHVSCYNTSLTTYDPNAKDAWGKSLDSIWQYRFDVKGYLGGAIWGMIDETFMMKDTMVGYGPWGIVDVWRRKKAEFWNTKKAYSPIRLDVNNYTVKANTLSIPVHNRFDHTSLKTVTATVTGGGRTVRVSLPDLPPHRNGVVSVPVHAADSSVLIRLVAKDGTLIDEERIFLKSAPAGGFQKRAAVWTIDKKTEQILLRSSFAQAVINGRTGAIETIGAGAGMLVAGNPTPVINRPKDAGVLKNTEAIFSGGYKISTFKFEQKARDEFVVYSQGQVDSFPVTVTTTLYADGRVRLDYTIANIPAYTWDIGIGIPVAASLNEIRWRRKGYWTTYPEGHLAATEGRASKTGEGGIRQYGVRPQFATAQGLQDFELTRGTDALHLVRMQATEMYRAKKEHIYQYTISGKTGAVEVRSNGTQAAKMTVGADGSQQLLVSDKWDYWTLSWGNYQGTRNKGKKMEGHAILQLKTE